MNKKTTYCLFFLLFLNFFYVNAQEKIIEITLDEHLNLGKNIGFFTDNEKKLNFEQISARPEIFQAYEHENINFGYNAKANFWLKFKVKNLIMSQNRFILEFPFPQIDTIDFYVADAGSKNFTKISSGSSLPFVNKAIAHTANAFYLDFSQNTEKEIFVRATGNSTMILDFRIWQPESFHENNRNKDIWYGLFLGLMGIMFLYNLVLAVSTRTTSYYWYVLSIFCAVLTFLSVGGYSFKYLWTDFPAMNRLVVKTSMAGIGIFSTSFAYLFLEARRYLPKFSYLMLLHIAAGILIFLLNIFPSTYQLGIAAKGPNTYVSITALLMLTAGILSLVKGNKVARFFVLSWVMYIFGGLMITLRNAGWLPFNDLTTHGAEAGAMLEVFLLSLALGDRYRLLRKEKDEAVRQTIDIQQKANQDLEAKVKERTQQFLEANEELKQTVEELDATNENLNELNDSLREQKTIIEKKNHDITSSINYAARIQNAILPKIESFEKSFGEAFVFFRPRDIVSGDFFWHAEKNNTAFFAVADCTGHGVPGSLMSMIGIQILNGAVFEKNLLSPAVILTALSAQIRSTLRQEETNTNDGMDIAVVSLTRENDRAVLRFAGAMNSVYIFQNGELNEIKGDKMAIGGKIIRENDFNEHQIILEKGEKIRFYLTTDGYYDQFGGEKDKKYLSKRFRELLEKIQELPMKNQEKSIENEFDRWRGKNPQLDDVTVAGAEIFIH